MKNRVENAGLKIDLKHPKMSEIQNMLSGLRKNLNGAKIFLVETELPKKRTPKMMEPLSLWSLLHRPNGHLRLTISDEDQ